jgi:hypothetical protein
MRQYLLRELKDEGITKVIWNLGELNSSDKYIKTWPARISINMLMPMLVTTSI